MILAVDNSGVINEPGGDITSYEAAHEDHGPTLLGLGAEGWVYTGVTIFFIIAFVFAKAHRKIIDGLDARIADTRRELDEAAQIRAEAEALLADAQKKQAQAATDAKAMLAAAETEADTLVAQVEKETKDLIARRSKMAEEKIAAAEIAAIADVRAAAASAAAAAAEKMIASSSNEKIDAALIDASIASLN